MADGNTVQSPNTGLQLQDFLPRMQIQDGLEGERMTVDIEENGGGMKVQSRNMNRINW